ncbi:hypothetical protein GYA93_21815 [Gordonia desulfuricans]|uniref:Uncharacterized protein n=1 Tax=Gordonia desulfuricans TaxID=89051 RepID=A0A7K3LVD8_9ACTN|nr:hypothetical protein [Gordonia desulfuricans]NDK92179.1 hypothetical protein [Gordonia desulfuricans]
MPNDKSWPCDPESVWAAAAPAAAPGRPTPPDIGDLDDFRRLAAPGDGAVGGAVVYAIAGAFFLAVGIVALFFRPDPADADGFLGVLQWLIRWYPIAPLAVGAAFLIAAPRSYRRDRADHPHEVRDLYEAATDRGILVEKAGASFRILDRSDGWVDAAVGVDVRLDAVRAAHIREAFRTWFALLGADAQAARHARNLNGRTEVRRAEEIFGPEATGGYLMRATYPNSAFALLIPDPPHTSNSWEELPIADNA